MKQSPTKKHYHLFVITGLSGAGKTSLADELLNQEGTPLKLKKLVSYTTRRPRPGETAGKDYFFITEQEFAALQTAQGFLETSCYNGNFYATPSTHLKNPNWDSNYLVVTDIKGAIALKDLFPDRTKLIFIDVASLEEAQKRLINRGLDSLETLEQRFERNLADLTFFMKHQNRFSLAVTNDNFANALKELYNFISQVTKPVQ